MRVERELSMAEMADAVEVVAGAGAPCAAAETNRERNIAARAANFLVIMASPFPLAGTPAREKAR
jgi:hypothetical protein